MSGALSDLASPQLADRRDLLLVVPIGSMEQHGPHLPLDTDTTVAVALARGLAATREDAVIGPPVAYGASGEHQDFPGTVSIGTEALRLVLVELGRSATVTFDRVLFVNGHGGNADAIAHAVAQLRSESRDVRAWSPRVEGGDAHAGHVETSMMLAINASRVRTTEAEIGRTAPLAEIAAALRRDGVRAVSPNGVLGDPTMADRAAGEALLADLRRDLADQVMRWWP